MNNKILYYTKEELDFMKEISIFKTNLEIPKDLNTLQLPDKLRLYKIINEFYMFADDYTIIYFLHKKGISLLRINLLLKMKKYRSDLSEYLYCDLDKIREMLEIFSQSKNIKA